MKQQNNMQEAIMIEAFNGDAKFANEASLTSDNRGFHRLSFLEVNPNGKPRLVCAVIIQNEMIERLHQIFGTRLNKPNILRPENFRTN